MQKLSFPIETKFLLDPKNRPIPDMVRDSNLYLDNNGLIRCDGRIGKTVYFDEDMINPILLPKDHPLFTLIVEHCHKRVKHLGIQATLNKLRLSGFRIMRPY